MLYNKFKKEHFEPPTGVAVKWSTDLRLETELGTYLTHLEKSRTSTINNKLRSFNYNFFMRNIPYEQMLYKTKPTNLCELCKEILHKHTKSDLELKPKICLLSLGRNREASREKIY